MPGDRQLLRQFGARLRARRVALGWSQEQLAERAGCSAGSISRIERGQSDTGITTVYTLARALDVGVEPLLPALDGGATPPTSPGEREWMQIHDVSTRLARGAEQMLTFAAAFQRPAPRLKRRR